MKIVIVVEAWSDRGKTSSLVRLIDDLALGVIERDKTDCLAVGCYRGLKVGVSSQGDPKSCMDRWVDILMGEKRCDVVFAACRPSQTYGIVSGAARRYGYEQIKTSTTLNVMGGGSVVCGMDLNEVDASRYRLMLDRLSMHRPRRDDESQNAEDVKC